MWSVPLSSRQKPSLHLIVGAGGKCRAAASWNPLPRRRGYTRCCPWSCTYCQPPQPPSASGPWQAHVWPIRHFASRFWKLSLHRLHSHFAGGQLWERVQAGTFPESKGRRLVHGLLSLVAAAHDANIVLRDIKLDNLLFLSPEDDAPLKAIDFGIATRCDPEEVLSERCGECGCLSPKGRWAGSAEPQRSMRCT